MVVNLADASGNPAAANGTATFDFKAPALAGKSADPANVPLGGTILVSFTPDEDLGPNPVLVASRTLNEPGGTRFTLTKQPGTRNYPFAHVVTVADGGGSVDFTAELTDPVGNSTTGVSVGRVVVDVVAPPITSLAVSPPRIRNTGTLSVTFDTDAVASTVTATVGERPMSCGAFAAGSPRYTCTRAMVGNGIAGGTEAAQSVVVAIADLAGNRTTASGNTVFDFRPPAVVDADLAYAAPDGSVITTVAARPRARGSR